MKLRGKIVVCCPSDEGADGLDDALLLGRSLLSKGYEVAFIAGDPARLTGHSGGWMPSELHQAPMRRPGPQLVMKAPSPDGLADAMALQGFDDKRTLLTLAHMWSRLFTLLRPDAILAFDAPLAWLVGPGHAPTFACGNGAALPPIADTSFPRLRPQSTPLADEELMLANANAALSMLGHSSLAALSDVLGQCTEMLYGVPALDPYLPLRRSITTGLLGEEMVATNTPVEPRLTVMIDAYCPGIETVILALTGFGQTPVNAWLFGGSATMRRFLAHQPHIQLWDDKAALLSEVSGSSVLVHHGEQTAAEFALALGRPQFVIPWTAKQNLLLQQLRPMGQTWEKLPSVPVEEMAGAFRAVLKDHSLVTSAQHHARQLLAMNLPDALPNFMERIESVIKDVSSLRDKAAST